MAAVLADVRRREYFVYQASEHSPATADNPNQSLTTSLGAASYTVATMARAEDSPGGQLRLKLRGIGRGDKMAFLPQKTSSGTTFKENKAAYSHGAAFAVDYENSPAGLRQNYTLYQRPAGPAGPVRVRLAINTSLQVAAQKDGQALSFWEGGTEVLRYAGLRAWDATGRVLTSRMQLSADTQTVALVVDDTRATYPLTIDPLISTPTTLAEPGPKKRTRFGHSIAGAGDVNGDGYADVLVAATDTFDFNSTTTYQSRVYLYQGSSTGLVTINPTVLVAPTTDRAFGRSMAQAGDIDKDGYADVLISAENATTGQGQAYLFRGSGMGLLTDSPTMLSAPEGAGRDWFGNSVDGAGDVDGDGYDDVVIGAFGINDEQGRAYLYRGSSAGLVTIPAILSKPHPATYDWFGFCVAGAGDVNGDGYDDVIIGAHPSSDGHGRAYLFQGSETGLTATPTILVEPNAAKYNQFGVSVDGAGDVDADGFDDVVVGILAGMGGTQSRAYLYRGSSAGLDTTPVTLFDPLASPGSSFGQSAAGVGDVDKDGYADVLIGSYGKGRAYLYHGSGTGLAITSPTVLNQPPGLNGALFSNVVAGAGDVDADGYADLLIGAETALNNQGLAYLYRGSSAEPLPVELVNFTATAAGPHAVSLAWATASETQNAGFTVERSTGGQIFASVAKLNGAGTSTAAHRYTFRDEHLPPGVAVLYYRLRQTDLDGTVSYSPVRSVIRPEAAPGFEVYPTIVVAGRARYRYTGPSGAATLDILNQSGQVVRTQAVRNASEGDLALAGLPGGIYVVRYHTQAGRYQSRCVLE